MTTVQAVLIMALLVIWICFSITILLSSIQSFIFDRRREKRERGKEQRDMEYHKKQMKIYK